MLTKVCIVKAMVFPVVIYGYEAWTIMKAECWRIDAFEMWYWRRLLRVLWTARRSNQSILKDQYSSLTQSCLTLCDPMDCSTPGILVLHHLLELAQTHVHRVGDAIQPSHPLSSPSSAFNLSQHQGLFQWVGSSHQVARVLELQLQLQHQSFQWIVSIYVLIYFIFILFYGCTA